MVALHEQRALFVAWQKPEARTYHTVGRLVQVPGVSAARFEFAYVRGAQQASEAGFRPFLAFPDLGQVYWSEELFPFFANRVISSGRPDFVASVTRLGLDPRTADVMTILARSGGVRATDSLEVFPLPGRKPSVGCYQTYFLAHDLPAPAQGRIEALRKNDPLKPLLDLQGGIALRTEDSVLVGYLPTYLLGEAWELMKDCTYIEVFVEQVNPSPAPMQQRLLCCLRSCWPAGFVPFGSPAFQPIAPEAIVLSSPEAMTTTTPAPLPTRDLFATIVGDQAADTIRLTYRDGVWSGDGILVSRDRVMVDGASYAVQSQHPFLAYFVHNGRQIHITE